MKVGIVGLGYVGAVTAAVLSEHNYEIIGVDIDKKKIELLSKGIPPIHEPGLKELLAKGKKKTFSTEFSVLKDAEVIFIAVPTPTVKESIDLSYVMSALKAVIAVNNNATIVIKSTVVPGTAAKIKKELGVKVVSNPEFIAEGSAIENTENPDRIIIGSRSEKSAKLVESVWAFTKAPTIVTSNENAELIKYASNAFLAAKISYINELANLCEKIPNSDIETVSKGMGLDKRIAPYFLNAGIGYGGSCFPKDTQALATFAKSKGERLSIVEDAIEVNKNRIERVMWHIKEAYGKEIGSAKIGVLGIAFKKNTGDTRESQSIRLIERLKKEKATIFAYDPVVKDQIEGVTLCKTSVECINNSDIVIIATDWGEFKDIKTDAKKIIIDGRRILDPKSFKNFRAIGLDVEHGR